LDADVAAALAEVVRCGLPLPDGLRALADESGRRTTATVLREMAHTIEQGGDWNLEKDRYTQEQRRFLHLVATAFHGGRLGESLAEFARIQRHVAEQRQELVRSLAYPCCILLLAGMLLLMWALGITPSIAEITADLAIDESNSMAPSAGQDPPELLEPARKLDWNIVSVAVTWMVVAVVSLLMPRYARGSAVWGR